MERTKEMLEARVRETPLLDRLKGCRQRIGKMCSEGRPPRMCIPVQHDDDDFFISTTLADAQAAVEALQAQLTQRTAELAAAKKVKADYDRWLSRGVYFTTAEYMAHLDKHRAELEALQRERDEWRRSAEAHLEVDEIMARDHQMQLDAEREKVKRLSTCGTDHSTPWWQVRCEDLEEQLSQLQALVRALVAKLDESDKASQGIFITAAMHGIHYNGPSYADELQALKAATLDATTPAPDTSIIGKCEPPSQWAPNAQVRGDIS